MLTIKTNNHFRPVLCGYELTAKEKKEFDYMTEDEINEGSFVRYRNWCYDLSCVMKAPSDMPEWDGINGDSFFSGILFKFSSCGDAVKCATYYN